GGRGGGGRRGRCRIRIGCSRGRERLLHAVYPQHRRSLPPAPRRGALRLRRHCLGARAVVTADGQRALHGLGGEARRFGKAPAVRVVVNPELRQGVEVAAHAEVDRAALQRVADGRPQRLVLGPPSPASHFVAPSTVSRPLIFLQSGERTSKSKLQLPGPTTASSRRITLRASMCASASARPFVVARGRNSTSSSGNGAASAS